MTEEAYEEKLSYVALNDHNLTMLLNGEVGYPIALPKYIVVKKKREDRLRIVERKILDGCHMHSIDYVSEDNVRRLTKDIVDLLYERENVAVAEAEQQQQQQPEPLMELTPELTRELTYEEVAVILSTSIKKDKAAKLITFCGMILAQTDKDQLNVGFQAESAAGKSWIPLELASYFPPSEVMKIAEASPKAFYHKGVWDEDRKATVCDLERKIVIFLDMPHFQLLERMRTVLSKDDKELVSFIVDKNKSGSIRTKTVIIKGFASFFFCTAKMDPDEQEKTRLILLSPSTDQEKLRESLELSALRNGNYEEYRRVIEQDPKRKWLIDRIYALRQSGIRNIIIPENGKVVLDRFLSERKHLLARHQRDLPRIFGLIKAHALWNAFNREKMVNGKEKPDTIIATTVDIEAGFALYKEIEESNELGLSPFIYRIYKEVIDPELETIIDKEEGLSRKDIRIKYYKVFHKPLPPKLEESILTQLETAGLIEQVPDPTDKRKVLVTRGEGGGGTGTRYIPHDTVVPPEKIEKNEKNGGYHPVPGNISPSPSSQVSPIALEEEKHAQNDNSNRSQLPASSTSHFAAIGSVIDRAMKDRDGNDKGYFTFPELAFRAMLLPNLHLTEDDVKNYIDQGLQEGKLIEIEPGKYKQPVMEEEDEGGS